MIPLIISNTPAVHTDTTAYQHGCCGKRPGVISEIKLSYQVSIGNHKSIAPLYNQYFEPNEKYPPICRLPRHARIPTGAAPDESTHRFHAISSDPDVRCMTRFRAVKFAAIGNLSPLSTGKLQMLDTSEHTSVITTQLSAWSFRYSRQPDHRSL
jgi:hypothetical protein